MMVGLDRSVSGWILVSALLTLGIAGDASAQGIGPLQWKLAPYCNTLTVTAFPDADGFRLAGFDDQCGASQRAPIAGMVTPNPDGTFAFTFVVIAPDGRVSHTSAALNPITISGPWTDSIGQTGLVGVGEEALRNNTSGAANVAIGYSALWKNQSGSGNIAIGTAAGNSLELGNSNIYIGNSGAAFDSNVIRLGGGQSYQTFVGGIRGVTTFWNNAVPVVIDTNGQLGTVSSSRRYKQDIVDMGDRSRRLLSLRPVTFRYISHAANGDTTLEYGLIAEEVAEVFPDLVVRTATGEIETVQYHKLTPMLLNELQRQERLIKTLQERLSMLEESLRNRER